MTYQPHDLFVMGGTLVNGSDSEIWQCTVRGVFAGSVSDTQRLGWLNGIKGPLATWFSTISSRMRSDANITFAKLNHIGPDGKYTSPNASNIVAVGPAAGGLAPTGPSFSSVAWSWATGNARGPGSHGRIYPPNTWIANATGSARITSSDATTQVAAAKSLLTLLVTAYGGIVFTPVVASKVGTGTLAVIAGVRVGNVIDLQRRRKNALTEAYTFSLWP